MLTTWLRRLKLRISDIKTINALFTGAEDHANQMGEEKPGAEHFVLAALDLPDGSARRALVQVGADPDQYRSAIEQQYRDALAKVGISADDLTSTPISHRDKIYKAKASADDLIQQLHKQRKAYKDTPLQGLHVLEVVTSMQQGAAIRALRGMGVDADVLHRTIAATR